MKQLAANVSNNPGKFAGVGQQSTAAIQFQNALRERPEQLFQVARAASVVSLFVHTALPFGSCHHPAVGCRLKPGETANPAAGSKAIV
jgi:hypothetical protein